MYKSIVDLIGNTPLVLLRSLSSNYNIYAKCEFFNPGFSIKDRVAKYAIEEYVKKGIINSDTTVVAPTSGNTGIGLCLLSKKIGFKLVLTAYKDVPIKQVEKLILLGADVRLFSSEDDANSEGGYVFEAKKMCNNDNYFLFDQFSDELNFKTHYNKTSEEILDSLPTQLDYFFVAVGSGGTFSGISQRLKEEFPAMQTIVVEPNGGIIRSHFNGEELDYIDHNIHSISGSFVPGNCHIELADKVVSYPDYIYSEGVEQVARSEGYTIGSSSGFVVAGMLKYCKEENVPEGANILVIFSDNGISE